MIELHDAVSRATLMSMGVSRRALAAQIRAGTIVRVRRDRYMRADAPMPMQDAVRVGGRLTCLSLLQLLEVFVFENSALHVHVERGASRLRSVDRAEPRLEPRAERAPQLHWLPCAGTDAATGARVGIADALAHAVLCLAPRHAVASIDSALNQKLLLPEDLDHVFAALPAKYAILRSLVDGRAQSGPETLVRLMARSLRCAVDLQKWFRGVGYVDMVLDGWLVVECDSKEFHSDWEQQVKDRNRDLALAARGCSTLRVTAAQIMYRPDEVMSALRGLVSARRACAA